MEIHVEQVPGPALVTILRLTGDLDSASYRELIAAAQQACEAGARRLLIDLSAVGYMGSSGLVALHRAALLARGGQPTEAEAGWRAFRDMGEDAAQGRQRAVRLLNPRPAVRRVLESAGMDQFFEIYADEAEALRAFAEATGP